MNLAYATAHYRYVFTCHLDSPLKDIVQLPMMSADQGRMLQDRVPQDSVHCESFRTSLGKR